MRMKSRLVLVLLMVMTAAGLTSATESIGHSEVRFSGGIEEQFTGSALHFVQELGSQGRLVLTLYRYESDADFTAISLMFRDTAPERRVYAINEDVTKSEVITAVLMKRQGKTLMGTPATAELQVENGQFGLDPPANAGELMLDSNDGKTLKGTLSFKGEMVIGGDTDKIVPFRAEATFESAANMPGNLPGVLGQPALAQ